MLPRRRRSAAGRGSVSLSWFDVNPCTVQCSLLLKFYCSASTHNDAAPVRRLLRAPHQGLPGQPKCNGKGTVDVIRGWSSSTVQAQAKQADKDFRSAASLAHWFVLLG